jgi:hypothetical protein
MNNIKKKAFFVIISVAMVSISMRAQDLIVTNEGDSLNCKITKIKTDYLYFTFKYKDEIRSTLLPLGQVKFHQYNYYQLSEVLADEVVGNDLYPHIRAAINVGWSYRVAKLAENIPSDFEEYMSDLKSGYHYGFDVSYYFTEQLGLGFKYFNYKSKNEIDNIYVTPPSGPTQYGKMSDDISISFMGPIFSTRLLNADKKNSYLLNLGIGYMGYQDQAVLISDYTINGNTVGFCWDIGYDIGLSENLALGFQFSYMIGMLRQYELFDGVTTETVILEDNFESLSRIDISIGLRFIK